MSGVHLLGGSRTSGRPVRQSWRPSLAEPDFSVMQECSSMTTATGTRERLIESALHRFAGDGVLATTLEDVRGDAGASVGAVYHHFPDKQALLDAARERALATFQTDFAAELERHAGAEEGIKAMVRFLIRWCFRNPDAANLLLAGRPRRAEALNRDFFDRVQRWWTPTCPLRRRSRPRLPPRLCDLARPCARGDPPRPRRQRPAPRPRRDRGPRRGRVDRTGRGTMSIYADIGRRGSRAQATRPSSSTAPPPTGRSSR